MAFGMPLAHQGGAVDRVDGEIAVRAVAVADLFAVVEHRRVVLLALADDHDAAHRHRVDQFAHGVDGGAVTALFVPAADPPACGHGTGLGDPDQFEGEVAVRGLASLGGRLAHGRDCPRSGWCVGGWDTGPVSMQPQPAPRPQKSRLLQDGRDMFWSMAPLVLACLVLAGMVGMCSFAAQRPARGPLPDYDAPAALKADAETLKFPDPAAALPDGWQANSGSRGRIDGGAHRPGDGQPVRAVRPRSATSRPRDVS